MRVQAWTCVVAACTSVWAGPDGQVVASGRMWRVKRKPMPINFADESGRDTSGCPTEYTHLLSVAQACCFSKIVKDPECCLDEKIPTGVAARNISRSGTSWLCRDYYYYSDDDSLGPGCYDSFHGPRGKDQMWIPEGATCSTPRVLYIHGGSWMYGSPFTTGYPQLASKLAESSRAVVFLIDYPLVPVGNYSSILLHSVQGLRWLAEHGPYEHCKPSDQAPLFVGGDSSGGGSALSLVMQLQADPSLLPGRQLEGAFLFSPWTNLMCNTPEYYHNAFAKIKDWDQKFVGLDKYEQFVGDIMFQSIAVESASDFSGNAVDYIGSNESLQTDPIASTYFSTPRQFAGSRMPALFFAVGGSESIMGDTIRVANTAAKGGADVTVEVHSGMWHVFPMYSEGCGSGHVLWSGEHVINSTGDFVRRIVAGDSRPAKDQHPRIHYLYSQELDKFEKVGELLPARELHMVYHDMMHRVSQAPFWVVVLSLGASSSCVFFFGFVAGGVCTGGGNLTLRRAKRVATYRRQTSQGTQGPGYVRFEDRERGLNRTGTFLEDFVRGVPHSAE